MSEVQGNCSAADDETIGCVKGSEGCVGHIGCGISVVGMEVMEDGG
jgi:hypothetical protein